MLLLLASNNNNDNNYKDIIRLKERRNNTYELWSKISYNYGHDFNNSNNNNNIHTIGITLGMDYNINNDKYIKRRSISTKLIFFKTNPHIITETA